MLLTVGTVWRQFRLWQQVGFVFAGLRMLHYFGIALLTLFSPEAHLMIVSDLITFSVLNLLGRYEFVSMTVESAYDLRYAAIGVGLWFLVGGAIGGLASLWKKRKRDGQPTV